MAKSLKAAVVKSAKSNSTTYSYISVPSGCHKCGGKCYDENQIVRQDNFRKAFPGTPLPDKCADACIGRTMCPAALGAL